MSRVFGSNFSERYPPLKVDVITARKKELNKSNFRSEREFERYLRDNRCFGFRKNLPLMNRYFGDFVWPSRMVVVEVDGAIHKEERAKKHDARKDQLLGEFGYTVFRVNYPPSNGEWEKCLSLLTTALGGAPKRKSWRKERTSRKKRAQERLEKKQKRIKGPVFGLTKAQIRQEILLCSEKLGKVERSS